MTTLERAIEAINKGCEPKVTVEQYLFGWSKTYLTVTTASQTNPFTVFEFDNVASVTLIKSFDSRIDAMKFISGCWLRQFGEKVT